ncbi:hypothetical protein [Nocardia gipuzkoensis]
MTIGLAALSIYTGVQALPDSARAALGWLGEVAGIVGLCGLCVHVALAWSARRIAVGTLIAAALLIGMSVAAYAGLDMDAVSTTGAAFYGALIATAILTTGFITMASAIIVFTADGTGRITLALMGISGLLVTLIGAKGFIHPTIGYPATDPTAFLVTAVAICLYGLAPIASRVFGRSAATRAATA